MISSGKRFELFFWAALPVLITALLAVLMLVPTHFSALSGVMPLLPLIPVFYWGALPGRAMPYWLVFIIGLVMDAAAGLPLGLSSLLYMVFLAFLRAQRKYFHKDGFMSRWSYFSALLLGVVVINLIVVAFIGISHDIVAAIIQWLLTVCCYPPLHAVFDVIHRGMSERRWHLMHGS